jgi:predicted RNase H-like HicB family nuclease
MTERKTYTVITGREKNWWWIEIPDVKSGFSQAKLYRQVEAMAREVISLLLDVPEDSFDVSVQIKGEEADLVRRVEVLEAAMRDAQAAVTAQKKAAVRQMRKKGIPVRDVAELLHVSTGQVADLSKENAA